MRSASNSGADIARALSQGPNNLYCVLEATGGIAPAQRSRSARVLSFGGAGEEISRGMAAGDTFRAIARTLRHADPARPPRLRGCANGFCDRRLQRVHEGVVPVCCLWHDGRAQHDARGEF